MMNQTKNDFFRLEPMKYHTEEIAVANKVPLSKGKRIDRDIRMVDVLAEGLEANEEDIIEEETMDKEIENTASSVLNSGVSVSEEGPRAEQVMPLVQGSEPKQIEYIAPSILNSGVSGSK